MPKEKRLVSFTGPGRAFKQYQKWIGATILLASVDSSIGYTVICADSRRAELEIIKDIRRQARGTGLGPLKLVPDHDK